jgi:hypothetical protein
VLLPPLAAPAVLPASALAAAAPALTPARATPIQATAAGLAAVRTAADKAVAGLDRAGGDASSAKASAQFATLTAEPLTAAAADVSVPAGAMGDAPSGLLKSTARTALKKLGAITQVSKNPERNKSFWLYVLGSGIFNLVYQMSVVGSPYLVSSMTRNALNENSDPRASNPAAIDALIDSNRSMARISFLGAQALSFMTAPLFTRHTAAEGPQKLLVRTTFIRAGILAFVPILFFSTGLLGAQASLLLLFGLFAVQSFFQGQTAVADNAAVTRMLGDSSVTADERIKANSIFTFSNATLAIIGPIIAGMLAGVRPVMEKTGVGSAAIYGVFAIGLALSGVVHSTIKLFTGPDKGVAAGTNVGPSRKGLLSTLHDLWLSIKTGTLIVVKDRLLRTLLILSGVSAIIMDPLIFSVLPKYIEHLVLLNPGSVGAVLNIPGIGWLLTLLSATPMGNFAMMIAFASVGSIIGAFLIKPVTALLNKLGFKTEESKTVPLYFLAALEAPLFLLMITTPTLLGVIALYGLQALATSFIGIAIQGLIQKKMGEQQPGDINRIMVAQSLISMAIAIASTFVYGFLLPGIALDTLMLIASAAIGAVAVVRVAAPFLAFSKESRKQGSEKK